MPSSKRRSAAPKPKSDTASDAALSARQEQVAVRLLAVAMGLPRICVFKACRRSKFCCGPDSACMGHHRGIVRKRIRAAIALITKPVRSRESGDVGARERAPKRSRRPGSRCTSARSTASP